jgi:hypothetical protein
MAGKGLEEERGDTHLHTAVIQCQLGKENDGNRKNGTISCNGLKYVILIANISTVFSQSQPCYGWPPLSLLLKTMYCTIPVLFTILVILSP